MIDKINNKLTLTVLFIFSLIALIIGSTLAYWTWSSNNLVTVNITTNMGGIGLTLNGGTATINGLAPARCTHSTYSAQVPITISRYNETQYPATVALSLKLTSLTYNHGTLTSTDLSNIHYRLSTQNNSCVTAVEGYDGNLVQGTLSGATIGTQGTAQSQNTTLVDWNYSLPASSGTQAVPIQETYYLYIWINLGYTFENIGSNQIQDPLQDLSFNISWSASSIEQTDKLPQIVYTANLSDYNVQGYNSVWIGQPISNNILTNDTYNTPTLAMAALETAGGGTTDYPFFLKHKIGDGTLWCLIEYDSGVATGGSYCIHSTQTACNADISNWEHDNITYTCIQNNFTDSVSESYVGFVITETMAANNPGMTAGTYYLKGGDNGASLLANAKVIYDAFGGVGCYLDGGFGGDPYTGTPSSSFYCDVSGLRTYTSLNESFFTTDGSDCRVSKDGKSDCSVGAPVA